MRHRSDMRTSATLVVMFRAAIVGLVLMSFASAARAECPPGKPCNDPKSVPAAKPTPPVPAAKPTPAVPAAKPAAPVPAAKPAAPVPSAKPAAPKRVDSCDAVRKREADLVQRLAAAEQSLAAAKQALADINARQQEEIRRLEEERRKLTTPLK